MNTMSSKGKWWWPFMLILYCIDYSWNCMALKLYGIYIKRYIIYYLKHQCNSPQVCTENIARGGMLRDKHSTRSAVFISRYVRECCIFHTYEDMQWFKWYIGILYFKLLLSHYHSWVMDSSSRNNVKQVGLWISVRRCNIEWARPIW